MKSPVPLLILASISLVLLASSASAVCICTGGPLSESCKACGSGAKSDVVYYTFKKGQLLSEIAAECGVDTESIKQANGLGPSSSIKIGQVLKVPGGSCGTSVTGGGSAPAQGCEKMKTEGFRLGGKYASTYRKWLPVLDKLAKERVGSRCYKGYDLVAYTAAIATKESGFGTRGRIFTGCGKPPKGQTVSNRVLYTQELQAKCTMNLLANGLDGRRAIGRGCSPAGDMNCLLAHYVGTGNKLYPIQVNSYAAQYRSLG
ncbi:MAG: LysM peptidoglycan-binding domain-containing protein [Candidatus Micrarchaeia archaeon]